MKFKDIPQFPRAYYRIDVGLDYLNECLDNWNEKRTPLILNPEWQRGHVWSEEQQRAYMEYFLRGGTFGKEIYFNCSSWQGQYNTPIFCLDGLQRITAAQKFLSNELKVFGAYFRDFEDRPRIINNNFSFNMMVIRNKRELLSLYVDFNSGGTPHNPKEIERVEKMIEECGENDVI